jgi:hypothetical protein
VLSKSEVASTWFPNRRKKNVTEDSLPLRRGTMGNPSHTQLAHLVLPAPLYCPKVRTQPNLPQLQQWEQTWYFMAMCLNGLESTLKN